MDREERTPPRSLRITTGSRSTHEVAGRWQEVADELSLSPRELSIVIGVCHGETRRMIAGRLGLSIHTIHSHMSRLYLKIGVSSRAVLLARVAQAYEALEDLGDTNRDVVATTPDHRTKDHAHQPIVTK